MVKNPKLDALEIVCAIKDSYGAFVYWNEALSGSFTLPPDGMIGKTEYHFMSDEDAAAIRANDKYVLNSGKELAAIEIVHTDAGEKTAWLVNKFRISANKEHYLAVLALQVPADSDNARNSADVIEAQTKITRDISTCRESMRSIVEQLNRV
ncbi:MAG TPA: PAS domain-containing protein [Drouetiella sp.]